VLCDIILLNFLKGADQYKAKKFEEVCILESRQKYYIYPVMVTMNASLPLSCSVSRYQIHMFRALLHSTGPETTASIQSNRMRSSQLTPEHFPLNAIVNSAKHSAWEGLQEAIFSLIQ